MADNFFAQLQLLTLSQVGVPETRKTLTELTSFMRSLPYQDDQIQQFANFRKLPRRILDEADSFMVTDDLPVSAIPEEYRADALGFVHGNFLTFSGRYVYPVKDVKGQVAGFVGYDACDDYVKYLDSKNFGYLAKSTMFFGEENLPQYYKDGYMFVFEGTVCSLYTRSLGLNALALLGSYIPPYLAAIMRRFGSRCIIIPDADEAGNRFRASARRNCPEARVFQSLVAKDVDDSRKVADIREDLFNLAQSPFYFPKYFR